MSAIVFLAVMILLYLSATAIAVKAYCNYYDIDEAWPVIAIAVNTFISGIVWNALMFGGISNWDNGKKGTKKYIWTLVLAVVIKACAIAIFIIW